MANRLSILRSALAVWLSFLGTASSRAQSESQIPPPPSEADTQPIYNVAPEPSDPWEVALRRERGNLFHGDGFPYPPSGGGKNVNMDMLSLQPFPVSKSDAVILGDVESGQAYLSTDGCEVYTEFKVRVQEVIKDNGRLPIPEGIDISVLSEGGALKLVSRAVIRYIVSGLGAAPEVGSRYVFFLTYNKSADSYLIVKIWELRDRQAVPVNPEDIARRDKGKNHYARMSDAEFLDQIREAAATISSP